MHLHVASNQTRRFSARSFVLAFSAVTTITSLLSILVLAFKANGSITYNFATDNGVVTTFGRLRPDSENGDFELAQYPLNLYTRLVKPTLAGAGTSLVLALSMGLLCVFVRRRGKALMPSTWQRRLVFLTLSANCVLCLVVLIINSVHRLQSAKFDPAYRSPATHYQTFGPYHVYDGGTFDLGSWACQLSAYASFDLWHPLMSRQCTDETAALWTSLLLVLSNLALAGLVWIDWRGPRQERILFRDCSAFTEEYECDYI